MLGGAHIRRQGLEARRKRLKEGSPLRWRGHRLLAADLMKVEGRRGDVRIELIPFRSGPDFRCGVAVSADGVGNFCGRPDIGTATKVANTVRAYGHATTEIWAATEWDKFNADIAASALHFHEVSRKEAVTAPAERRAFLEALPSRLQPLPANVRSAEHLLNHNLIGGVTSGSPSEF